MPSAIAEQLTQKKCVPCEGGVPRIEREEANRLLAGLEGWSLENDDRMIRKSWKVKDFQAGIDFFNKVAELAESEDHHPDLHLSGYRNVMIELSTHAIGGLSENDFILAAKIDQLPVDLKS